MLNINIMLMLDNTFFRKDKIALLILNINKKGKEYVGFPAKVTAAKL